MRSGWDVKFPDQQGKYREFGTFWAVPKLEQQKKPLNHWAFSQNSLEIGTGNFDRSGNSNSLIRFRSANYLPHQNWLYKLRATKSEMIIQPA
jgi:hypothetical protein